MSPRTRPPSRWGWAVALAAVLAISGAGPAKGSKQDAELLLDAITEAKDAYALPTFYAKSRAFLERYPDHRDADAVRYDLALQLVTENLGTPTSAEAVEARRLLDVVAAHGRGGAGEARSRGHHPRPKPPTEAPLQTERESLRFDAALVRLKFALPAERARLADAMLEAFAAHPDVDQVLAWRVGLALEEGDVVEAGRWAARLLARPGARDPQGQYRDVVRRAGLVGAPWPKNFGLDAPVGKVMLVDFFASWCAPCAAESPRLVALAAREAGRGLEVRGVSLDEDEAAHRAFVRRHHLPWKTIRSPRGRGGISDALGIGDLPTYVLVDRAGRIRATDLRGPRLEALVDELLAAPAPKVTPAPAQKAAPKKVAPKR